MSKLQKIPLKDIQSVTSNFAQANFIGEGVLGKIYEGRIPDPVSGELIDVSVRRLDHSFWLQDVAFAKEISILSRLKHENMVSIVGFCNENNEMLIVNKRVARGSLCWHLNEPMLTWRRRLQISIGVVRALSYLHNDVGPGFSVIHHNINSNSILLDENWEPKISGFEYSKTIPTGHLDLAYEKLGFGTYKSDVFSVGIVLFELLCGTKAFDSKDDNSVKAKSAIFHYKNGKLHELVDQDLFHQMHQQSFIIFKKIAYDCLVDWRAPQQMKMDEVLLRLQKALEIQQMHENNEQPIIGVLHALPDHLMSKRKNLEHMRIRLADILLATEKFASKYCIASGGFGSVYTAKLKHVDKGYRFAIDSETKPDVPMTRSKVAIKRIISTGNEIEEQGFYAEIEMLTRCMHSNIVTLLGFCYEGLEMILIYEYASNGSLNDYFSKERKIDNISWAQRVKICLDAAKGLSFLHTADEDRREIVHRDIKSANILLDEKFEAKIGDFGLSVIPSVSEEHDTRYYKAVVGTPGYWDPQYIKDSKLKTESDVYSFGVVLFEILFGTLSYDKKYTEENGLAFTAKDNYNKKRILEMVDPKIKEQITETIYNSVRGPSQESLDMFSEIAYKCLAEAQAKRPTMEVVVKELEKALYFQENRKDLFQISFKDIQLATNNFSEANIHEDEGFGTVYKGQVVHADGHIINIYVKRLYSNFEGYALDTELKVLMEHKHPNIIGLIGYCIWEEERIIVYEHALNGSLDEHLVDVSLTWGKRLKICIDIANGLDILHGGFVTGEVVIHRDIKSNNILLDDDMNAKIYGFGLSLIHPIDQKTVSLDQIAGTETYWEPQYARTGLLSKECDIYSFGILLFEIMLKRFAYSFGWEEERDRHLGPLIKDLYKKGKLDELMFEGTTERIAPQSLTIFRRIAIQCLHENRKERPTAREAVIQLNKALEIQEKGMGIDKISIEDIKYATDNFNDENCIGRGGSGKIFKGQLPHANEQKIIAAKRFDMDNMSGQGDPEFYRELEIIFKFKHRNIIGLEGYCDEMNERIIVYEYVFNKSLDEWLDYIDLTWMKRLEICIDVARGLDFLHGGVLRQETVIHRDINSSNILLSGDWEAKISDFGFSLISPNNQEIDYVKMETIAGTESYIDPTYIETGIISKASDIYSFGVVLFEILCGRNAYPTRGNPQPLGPLVKDYYDQNKLDELVFEGIKKHIVPQSLSTFAKIAYKCLHDDRHQRPTASEVVVQLNKAKEFQVDYEMWEPKLPSDYKEIIQQSHSRIRHTKKRKEVYDMLCEGILIQKREVWFSLGDDNKRNEMISATLFTYKNKSSQKWIQNKKSRFQKVPLMMDISNLNIQAKIKAQFLTPGVIYGVYLVFKFAHTDKISSKAKYVNLKYKMEGKTLHAYFATFRKDNWMMIELYRFRNQEDAGDFEVLLESLSRYHCGSAPIYVEGIEFRAIDNVTHEENEKLKDALQILRSSSNTGQMQHFPADNDDISEFSEKPDEGAKLFQPSETNLKKHHILSAKEALHDSSNVKLFRLMPSEHTRFEEVIEVLSQQVFRIKCKIESPIVSPDTNYRCYLIFKLSEKCCGLHCPVKVRRARSNKVIKNLYVRSQETWNIHDINQVAKQREDGWMEVNVWEFNSKDDLRKDCIHVNLKLISYEGTMSGLIVCGLEFRPM